MHQPTLLFIIFCHASFAFTNFPYQSQNFKLPKHPSGWMCTVHITTATFANSTSSDIIERFLSSNHGKIIPTLSTMLNRSISIVPVISFFEPCTISLLVDATVTGSSYVFREQARELLSYINKNEYVYRGWRHSIIILIYFTCSTLYNFQSLYLPHRLFYHSLDCGPQNVFPNQVFVPGSLHLLRNISDTTHNIHHPQLPLSMTRLTSVPKYSWDEYKPHRKVDICLARQLVINQTTSCSTSGLAVSHFQHYLNFTAVAWYPDKKDYGWVITRTIYTAAKHSTIHAIGTRETRLLYCDRNSDSPRFRPVSLSSPFSFKTWIIFVFLWILCAIARSFTVLECSSVANNWTKIGFIKMIFSSVFVLGACVLEKDLGRRNFVKTCIGLMAICLGSTYKNYLTIELVFPRAADSIQSVTELLDLNFNIIQFVNVKSVDNRGRDKLSWLKEGHFHFGIDEVKREKYVREVDRWLRFVSRSDISLITNELASGTAKNALMISAPYYLQGHHLNLITESNHGLSCHFVKRPFARAFWEFYFVNPKAEEFKRWTAKFLDHGLVEFWKRLHSHQLSLQQRTRSLKNRSKRYNSSSTEALDIKNFIGQVHLFAFYIVLSKLTAVCSVIFIFECTMHKALQLSLFVLRKFKQLSLQVLGAIVRFLFLMSRQIRALY
jgi:hypothetical protein